MRFSCLLAVFFLWSIHAHARTFSNSFLSFALPDGWVCQIEGVAWVCTPKGLKDENEAVIVMAAKVASPEDTLANFLTFLQKPKTITSRVGTPVASQVVYAQERMLDNSKWIQAQHIGSEVPDFYTLYIATVKESLAILVTFSVDKAKANVYNPVFDQAMKTLRITASKNLVFKSTSGGTVGVFGVVTDGVASQEMLPPPPRRRSKMPFVLLLSGFALLTLVGVFYFYNPPSRKKKK